jgi:hypothetical protein
MTSTNRPTYIDGSDALSVLDGSAKSCDLYVAMHKQSAKHRSMLDQLNAAFSA